MYKIKVNGKQSFMGTEIPVVLGGFGKDKKCVTDKMVAEIHNQPSYEIRRRISDNIKRFNANVDFIDMKKRMGDSQTLELLMNLGYAKQSITQAEHIYLLSERGYAKLIKIMDSDLAWEIHDKLIDEYFQLREERREIPRQDTLASVNTAVKTITEIYREAGVAPEFIAVAAQTIYKEKAKIDIPLFIEMKEQKLWDNTSIATELGILSMSGKPHLQAVGAIISRLHVRESDIIRTPFERNGHSGVTVQYKQPVLDDVRLWLEENGFPSTISYVDKSGNSKTCKVVYQGVA